MPLLDYISYRQPFVMSPFCYNRVSVKVLSPDHSIVYLVESTDLVGLEKVFLALSTLWILPKHLSFSRCGCPKCKDLSWELLLTGVLHRLSRGNLLLFRDLLLSWRTSHTLSSCLCVVLCFVISSCVSSPGRIAHWWGLDHLPLRSYVPIGTGHE